MSSRLHTNSGRGFNPLSPSAFDVHLGDIATGLGNTCRFGGQTPKYYSVAQHAVLVAQMVLELSANPHWGMLALHHDSAEAYLGDIPRPIKRGVVFRIPVAHVDDLEDRNGFLTTPFELAEARVLEAILQGLGIADDRDAWEMIRDADNGLLEAELRSFFAADSDQYTNPGLIKFPPIAPHQCQTPDEARHGFLHMHHRLLAEMGQVG